MKNRLFLAVICIVFGLFLDAHAQTPVMPYVSPNVQFFDANGVPLALGCVFTYQAGTTTPQNTYTDSAGTSANTNPIILDSGGEATIWMGLSAYKFVVVSAGGTACASGVTQRTIDNVSEKFLRTDQANALSAVADPGGCTLGLIWMSTNNAGRLKWCDSTNVRTVVATDTTDSLSNKTIVAGNFTGTETHSGQIQSTIAAGTPPLTVASTTPVATLIVAAHTKLLSCAGNNPCTSSTQLNSISLYDGGSDYVLAGGTLTITGLPFTAINSYECFAWDQTTGGNKVVASNNSAASVTFTGTGTDHFRFHCDGN